MISILTRRKEPKKIGYLELDAMIREEHSFRNIVTEYPVEDGFDISDHVWQEPETVTIEGFISNTPVQILGGKAGEYLLREDFSNKVQVAYGALLEMSGRKIVNSKEGITIQYATPVIIDIVTILNVYTSMIITDLKFPVTKGGGNSQYFTCTAKKLVKVKSDITIIQNISNLGGKAANAENQAANKTKTGKKTPEQKEQSFLDKLLSAVENKLDKTTNE